MTQLKSLELDSLFSEMNLATSLKEKVTVFSTFVEKDFETQRPLAERLVSACQCDVLPHVAGHLLDDWIADEERTWNCLVAHGNLAFFWRNKRVLLQSLFC